MKSFQNDRTRERTRRLWGPLIARYPAHYLGALGLVIVGIPPSLFIIILGNMALRQLQGPPRGMTWMELLGEHASRWIRPLVRGTEFEGGLSLDDCRRALPLLLIGTALFVGVVKFLQEYLIEDLGERLSRDLRRGVARRYLSFPFPAARQTEGALLANLLGEDAREIRQTFTRLLGSMIADGLSSLVYLAWMVLLDTQLFLLFCAVFLPAGIIVRFSSRTLKRLARQGLQIQTDLLSSLLERMAGWQTIRVHAAVGFELDRFERTSLSLFHTWRRSARARAASTPLVEWLALVAASVVFIMALRRIADGALESSVLTQFLVTFAFLANSSQTLTSQMASTRRGVESLRRCLHFIGSLDNLPQSGCAPLEKLDGHSESRETGKQAVECLSLVGLTVSAPDGRLLASGVSLDLVPGDFLVVVGPSGCGKSTLLRIALGLESASAGHALWNGVDQAARATIALSRDSEAAAKSAPAPASLAPLAPATFDIGFVAQEPFLFSGRLIDNVTYPLHSGSTERVRAALELANLAGKDPQESVVGFSGGERQRILFARMFFHEPSIVFIDEGTSALDVANEREILKRVKHVFREKMIVMVAHRASCVEYATKVLDLGKHHQTS